MSDYSIVPRAYLERARAQLRLNTPESLFYAALELRCGIEARLVQYLEPHEQVEEKKKNEWNLRRLAATVEKTFKIVDRIAKIDLLNPDTEEVVGTFYYTPVKQIEKHRVRLDRLLHRMKRHRKASDRWWDEQRQWLAEVEHDLAVANTGTLLGPLLLNRKTGEAYMVSEIVDPETVESVRVRLGGVGAHVLMRVTYPNDLQEALLNVAPNDQGSGHKLRAGVLWPINEQVVQSHPEVDT